MALVALIFIILEYINIHNADADNTRIEQVIRMIDLSLLIKSNIPLFSNFKV